ncbi:transposon Ty3-I Gag-Pol polyprotein [Trichonephila clavipes]|nr:transposon Ty3-I Gag-Pol polyprotein [Trichonephila clavipes]
MRQIGKCFSAGFKLCGTLNLPRFSKTAYTNHENKLMLVNSEVSELSMQKAASELLVLHPTKNKIVECGISVDGTWQRRGYSSMNGCVAALSVDTGKLTDSFIDRLQNYYGIAVRSNVGNLSGLQPNVIAALFHCSSSVKKPMHGQCPIGKDSWCYYQRALSCGKKPNEKYKGLSNEVLNTIKPTYLELCTKELLTKCLHGKTQNSNECLNGVIWQRVPKEVFVCLKILKSGALDAVIQFNDGYKVIDAFSKFTWLYPTRSTDAAEVINRLENQRHVFGNPTRIITDKGSAFTSSAFEDYCKKQNILHISITTGLPRSNGQIEKQNSTIIAVLSKLSVDDPEKCLIPREQRDALRQDAKKQIYKVQDENRRTYNLRRRQAHKYKLHDLVAIKRTQFGPGLKLKQKYLGPYKVTKVKHNDTYDVEKCDFVDGPSKTSTGAEFMKLWSNQTNST